MSLFWFLICFYVINGETYIQCGDIIPDNNGRHIIICDNNCNECNIKCYNNNCWNSNIYSGALNTIIDCNGQSSCSWSTFKIGYNYAGYPTNYYESNFIRKEYQGFIMNCNERNSCFVANIYVKGNFINGVYITGNKNARNGLRSANIEIDILPAQLAVLNCGDHGNTICYNVDYRCISGNCVCVGDLCTELSKDYGVVYQSLVPSMSPTITPTKTPSISPTISPSDIPSLSPTNHPSNAPSIAPTQTPTLTPTQRTEVPTKGPSISPTNGPSNIPTSIPTQIPSLSPSQSPSNIITTNFLSSELPTKTPSETSETMELPDVMETPNTVTSIALPFNLTLLLYIMAGGSLIILCCILLIIFLHCYWSHKAKMSQKHNKISFNIAIPDTTSGSGIAVPKLSPNTDDGIDRIETIGGNDSPEPETNGITTFTPGYDNESESESSQSILNNDTITPNIFVNTNLGDNKKHELNKFSNNNNVTRINI